MPTSKIPGTSFIGSSALARISICAHFWHLQCFADATEITDPAAGALRQIQAGLDFETKFISTQKTIQPEYPEDRPWDGIQPTIQLMQNGAPLIYQGVLCNDRIFGIPDLLEKIEKDSKLGSYSYRPVDVKSHAKVSSRDKKQLAAYALMLEPLLGYIPDEGGIYLSNGFLEIVSLKKDIVAIRMAFETALKVESQSIETLPLRCGECSRCQWSDYCDHDRRDQRLVANMAGIDNQLSRKFVNANLPTYDQVAIQSPGALANQIGISIKRAEELIQVSRVWTTGQPEFLKKPDLPARNKPYIHYDIETFGDCVYLHGVCHVQAGEIGSRQFVARTCGDERYALKAFLEFVADWPDVPIYTWTKFENAWLTEMVGRYPEHAAAIKQVAGVLIDLKDVVKDSVILPVTTFSIKEVGPYFGFAWRAEDAGGGNSEAWYEQWLETGDESILTKILQYNEDDVLAMEHIVASIRKMI